MFALSKVADVNLLVQNCTEHSSSARVPCLGSLSSPGKLLKSQNEIQQKSTQKNDNPQIDTYGHFIECHTAE
jgi:hypothetical protein